MSHLVTSSGVTFCGVKYCNYQEKERGPTQIWPTAGDRHEGWHSNKVPNPHPYFLCNRISLNSNLHGTAIGLQKSIAIVKEIVLWRYILQFQHRRVTTEYNLVPEDYLIGELMRCVAHAIGSHVVRTLADSRTHVFGCSVLSYEHDKKLLGVPIK